MGVSADEMRRVNGIDHIWSGTVNFGVAAYPVENGILAFGGHPNQSFYDTLWEEDFRKQRERVRG